jgi:catechol 2,3-dioxygenase-like lactoylglutathione lyase family enzyme
MRVLNLIRFGAGLILVQFLCSSAMAEEDGYANFVRTTIVAQLADLEPSVTFWRDVMGFEYAGEPTPRTGSGNAYLGWDENATTYFTSFTSKQGSTVALLMIEEQADFPTQAPARPATAYGSVVLVHTAEGIRDIYDRAVAHGVEIVKPYGPSSTHRSIQIMLRAPTGHFVEIFELIDQSD